MTAINSDYRAKRPLTTDEIGRVVDAINDATNTKELLNGAVRAIFTPLLSDHGARWEDFGPHHRLNPADYAIPKSQLDALTTAIISRADEWGTSVHLALDLINVLPASYDAPGTRAPAIDIEDRRPYVHCIHVSREAADVIAACETHLADLAEHYGRDSDVYQTALAGWHRHLAGLFAMRLGAETRVSADGALSLFVATGSGFVYGIIWHAARRRCTVPGCGATIRDDGTIDEAQPGADTSEHVHQPSYPLDAPPPGEWSAHSLPRAATPAQGAGERRVPRVVLCGQPMW